MRALDLLLAALSCAAVAGLQCAQRREISPCSCYRGESGLSLKCERVGSYSSIAAALGNRFPIGTTTELTISHSDIHDLSSFLDLGLIITKIYLNHDNISEIDDVAFIGLRTTEYLSLADNELSSVPRHVLRHLPNLKTLDLGRNKIKILRTTDLKDVQGLQHLVLIGNGLKCLERNSLPMSIKHLQIGANQLTSLNGTVRHLNQLEWFFFNNNALTSVEHEIPMSAKRFTIFQATSNNLENLPRELRNTPSINILYILHNNIKTLNGVLQKSRHLESLNMSFNKIEYLAHDDFAEATSLAEMDLGHNLIHTLNGSLNNLTQLNYLNLTHNQLPHFSFDEIKGLKKLWVVDLSYNTIEYLIEHTSNTVDAQTELLELRLSYNKLRSLGGALIGLHKLMKLNVSHNYLESITPDDLFGLDLLKVLDISHNHIKTLEDTSKLSLPQLTDLQASYNKFILLDKDVKAFPNLCNADFSHNDIEAINYEIVKKSMCEIHQIKGTLKIHLNDNPVLCDENFPSLNKFMTKFQVRFYGECIQHRPPATYPPTVVASSLLNDVGPRELLLSQMDNQINAKSKMFPARGSKLVQIISGKDGELPIIVYPPITLPPVTPTITAGLLSNQQQEVHNTTPEPPPKII